MDYNIEYLYKEYKNDVYSYLFSITRDRHLAEDLTSETFLGAIRSLSSFKGKSAIRTWLFGIARNKWYEYLKKKKGVETEADFLELYAESEMNTEESAISRDCVKRIYEILDGQSRVQRGVFLMRIQGYSFGEIGESLGISESSARVTDFRLKNKIRSILKKEGYTDE